MKKLLTFIGQEEGTLYGRYLLGQAGQYNGAVSMDRIEKVLAESSIIQCCTLGVIGGITFGGTMSIINNLKVGNIEEKTTYC